MRQDFYENEAERERGRTVILVLADNIVQRNSLITRGGVKNNSRLNGCPAWFHYGKVKEEPPC